MALAVHKRSSAARQVAEELIGRAAALGFSFVGEDEILEEAGVRSEPGAADVAVAVGGDGTVLKAVQLGLAHDIPVFGVNVGRIGFLADVEPDMIGDALDTLASGTWREYRRMTIAASTRDGRRECGVNDVVVEKRVSQRVVSIKVAIDGEPFLTYNTDGLVFSTPTGSTAYNLSAGGPLVHPGVEAIVMTPVAHHSLFSTPLVLPASAVLTCTVERDRSVGVNVDSHDLGEVEPGEAVTIQRGDKDVRFIDHSGRSYPRLITEKLRLE